MAVTKPRNRSLIFRLTQDEYEALQVASNESFLLIGNYFCMTKGLGLGLEVGWSQELCFK